MSALSGITVSQDLAVKFADAVQSNTIRFIKISIQNESLVHDRSYPIERSFEDDLIQLQQDDVLPANTPAYILVKLDLPSSDWISIYYVPDSAPVREKMLYASTRLSLLKSLGSTLFTDSIFATSKADLTADAYASHVRHTTAPNPLSKREQELADLRASESQTATYEGSRARSSHIGAGVGLPWSEDVQSALVELGSSTESTVVVIVIDSKSETLALHHAGKIDVNFLGNSLPELDPCYALFAWGNQAAKRTEGDVVFIYSCPSLSPIKNRMIYSSGSSSAYEMAKRVLTSISPAVSLATRKIETSDPKELNGSYLEEELGLADPMRISSQKVESTNPKGFARPKGPPRRR